MAIETVTASLSGGARLTAKLKEIARGLGNGDIDVSVGFQNGATYPEADGGLSVAQVAFWNNFGTRNSPPRPFIANFVEDQQPTWANKLGIALRMTGYQTKNALEILGADMAGHMRESINLLTDPPNAPYTLLHKKGSKPLVDTGWMLKNVTWVVKKKNSET
jgi:hypothetical protein